jgi:hypothetical protein
MMKGQLVIFFVHWSRWTSSQNDPRHHQLKQKQQLKAEKTAEVCHSHQGNHHSRATTTTTNGVLAKRMWV